MKSFKLFEFGEEQILAEAREDDDQKPIISYVRHFEDIRAETSGEYSSIEDRDRVFSEINEFIAKDVFDSLSKMHADIFEGDE